MKKLVLEKLSALVIAAFGLVAALAWNEAIKSLFAEGGALYFIAAGGIWIYAIIVTVIAVLVSVWIAKAEQRAKSNQNEEKKE